MEDKDSSKESNKSSDTGARTSGKLHPAILVAAIAVTTICVAGLAMLAFPSAKSEIDPFAPGATPPVAVAPPAAVTPHPVVKPAPVYTAPRVVERPVRVADHRPARVADYRESARDYCRSCGTIQSIKAVKVEGEGSGLGAVLGAGVGAAVGNQIGKGHGREAARVVGILGGAYAGHQIEKYQRSTTRYDITVRMEDGSIRHIRQDSKQGLYDGERVHVEGNHISPR